MMEISNDQVFKVALTSLPLVQQRLVGALFVEDVLNLAQGNESRLRQTLAVASKPDPTPEELGDAYRIAKAIAVETYTTCGQDADWLRQASHFVAAGVVACLVSPGNEESKNLAWTAAMNARMARTCQSIATGEGKCDTGVQKQYEVLKTFLRST